MNTIKLIIITITYAVALCSCVDNNIKPIVTSEGCIGIGNDKFNVAQCPNGDVVTTWKQIQTDGTYITAKAIRPKTGKVRLYVEQNGVFIAYDSSAKSSITIGAVPVSEEEVLIVEEAIKENQ